MGWIGEYLRGPVVNTNPENLPGAGSHIFRHVWLNPGHPTAGCIAMEVEPMDQIIHWLDQAKSPILAVHE